MFILELDLLQATDYSPFIIKLKHILGNIESISLILGGNNPRARQPRGGRATVACKPQGNQPFTILKIR